MDNDGIQPGQTVTPSSAPAPAPDAPAAPPAAPEPPAPQPGAPASDSTPAPQDSTPAPPPAGEQQFKVSEFDAAGTPADAADAGQPITWTASEFIAHAKSFGWYALLALAAAAGAALTYFLTKDKISAGVIIAAALILGIYAGHKPRELQYKLDNNGLSIGGKYFRYDQFRSFAVIPEGAFSSIVFMPLRRFAVPTTIYYAPEDENKIVDMLGSRLPFEQHGHDAVDRLMHRIHF